MAADVKLTIDGTEITVPAGTLLIDACAKAGADVPALCRMPNIAANASCGICVVEVDGAKSLVRSCVQNAGQGMRVKTSSPRVMTARRTVLELLLANHPADCLSCVRSGTCELQDLAERLGARRQPYPRTRKKAEDDVSGGPIVRDNDKCVLCGRCVAVCRETQGVSAIDFAGRGVKTRVVPFREKALRESVCVSCGQCTVVCPTGALTERDDTDAVFKVIADQNRTVVAQTAPAIRAALGEALGMAPGSLVTGKMVAALRRLGFKYVFDTQFTADLTIMEEGSELLSRVKGKGVLPMITSCSPGWITFIETFYPDLLPHLSTCKSPQQMFGALAKGFWAQKAGLDPATVTVVSIMPCTAKKSEAERPEMNSAWEVAQGRKGSGKSYQDVDFALTTRELARMIKRAGIDFEHLKEEPFDNPLGASTGAAVIFGTTGGVMEAAVRTVYEIVEKKPLEGLELQALRGFDGIKTAELVLGGSPVKVAVAHTLSNARVILDEIAAGKSPYAFIEVMTCPGGCIGGGGQPVLPDWKKKEQRREAIYREDRGMQIRRSHENPDVQALYKEFLGEPLGHKSHELLHTKYHKRTV